MIPAVKVLLLIFFFLLIAATSNEEVDKVQQPFSADVLVGMLPVDISTVSANQFAAIGAARKGRVSKENLKCISFNKKRTTLFLYVSDCSKGFWVFYCRRLLINRCSSFFK